MITMGHPGPIMRLQSLIKVWVQTMTPVVQDSAKYISDCGRRPTVLPFLGSGVPCSV